MNFKFLTGISNNEDHGVIYCPYRIVTTKITVNNRVVWHRNKFINFLLKIKFFYIKSPYFYKFGCRIPEMASRYGNRTINPSYYGKIEINNLINNN